MSEILLALSLLVGIGSLLFALIYDPEKKDGDK